LVICVSNDDDKIILSDNNMFWFDPDYRRRLLCSGVDITKYVRADGTNNTIERGIYYKYI
jgi:hypothetical protein